MGEFLGTSLLVLILVGFVAVIFIGFISLLARRYKRCPSNKVLVIYGKTGSGAPAKTIHGGAAFVWPLFQDYAYLPLEPLQIPLPLREALSMENIRVNVPSVFTVAIGTHPEIMQNAAIRLLGLDQKQIEKQAEDIIFGQLRQVVASMSIDEINRDREMFLTNIQNSLEPELRKIGLVLINVNITDITDESGYIEAIGRKAASQAVQQARGDVADQEKLGEVRVAEAEREKLVQVAQASKAKSIGIRENQREEAVRLAELEKEQRVGEQRAGYERDTQVKVEEQKMRVSVAGAETDAVSGEKDAERERRIAVAAADAKAVEGENSAKATIADSEAQLQLRRAEAYQLGETRKREAEAAVLEAQNRALAKAALAEAERVEAERRAQVEAPAKAVKAQTIVEAEAAAEKRRIEAEGEAKAIFAKLEAEAKGQFEILARKAEGLHAIVQACGGSQEAFQMLMLEHIDDMTRASAEAISNIKFDKVVVWENGLQNGSSNTASFLHSMARTLPPIMQVMKDVAGVDLPDYFAQIRGRHAAGEEENGSTPATTKPDGARGGAEKA